MTPEELTATFAEVARTRARCLWLDGGGARAWSGQRSLLGWLDDDDVSLTYDAVAGEVRRHAGGRSRVVGDDPFAVLEAELAAGRPTDQWFGHLGYAARRDLPAAPDGVLPDACWMRPSHLRVVRHPAVTPPVPTPPSDDVPPVPDDYAAGFAAVQEELRAGNSYEVNLTRREQAASADDPASVYLRLRALNPAPYAGFLQHDVRDVPRARAWLLSSSPERYALVSTGPDGRMLETRPIKGTTPRDPDPVRDRAARDRLAVDPRFRAENLMIVDLLRNDLAQVCEVGSVVVPSLMEVEAYTGVHQLVSTVRGRLHDDVSTVAALRALFPAGSMTGAPKLRTMQIIDRVETSARGGYAGAFGWVGGDGRADLGVVIRSLTTDGGGTYRLGTGGGITVRSEVGEEWAESCWKADRLRAALLG